MEPKFRLVTNLVGTERIKFGESLSFYTHTRVGGPADAFFIATTQAELIKVLDAAYQLKIPYFVFGSGTKILISEKGIRGLVIKNRTSGIRINGIKGRVGRLGVGVEEAIIEVDSGVTINKLNDFLSAQGLKQVFSTNSMYSTIGGAIFLDPDLSKKSQKILIWENGSVINVDYNRLNRNKHIVLSAVFKFKSESRV